MSLQFPNNTLLGFAIQQGAGADDHAKMAAGYEQLVTTDGHFNYFPLTDASFGVLKGSENTPPETGGQAFPTGAYPTGTWGVGPVSMIPRLSNRLGWLLLAGLGDVESVADTKIENLTEFGGTEGSDTDINSHIFRPFLADKFFLPWITIRKLLPHVTDNERPGEIFQDGRIRSLTINGAAAAPLGLDLDLVARVNQSDFVFNQLSALWSPTYDNFDDFGVTSCEGWVKIGGVAFKVTRAAFNLVNTVLPPEQSIVIGSMHPIDFPTLARQATLTATIMLEDYDLYVSTFAGTDIDFSGIAGGSGENVSCTIYQADLDIMFASQTPIGAAGDADEPFRLRIVNDPDDDNVAWNIAPIRIQPGRPVVLQITGNVQGVAATEYPLLVCLQNDVASYALPV